jgi:hypothetical protein
MASGRDLYFILCPHWSLRNFLLLDNISSWLWLPDYCRWVIVVGLLFPDDCRWVVVVGLLFPDYCSLMVVVGLLFLDYLVLSFFQLAQ